MRLRIAICVFALLGALAPATADAQGLAQPNWVESTLARMTLEQKVGQLFSVYVFGSDATNPSASDRAQNLRYYGFETPAEIVDRYALGGATYFVWANNLPDPRQTAVFSNGLQRSALSGSGVPMLIATDEEQGYVHRLPAAATLFPGSMALGASGRADDAYRAAQVTGAELRAMGIHDAYAPVADVHLNPLNPVTGVRAYSDDPLLAARLTAAQVLGFQRGANVVATPKTFPGHGDTDKDSHVVLPVIDHTRAEWERLDAPPFRAAIAAGVDTLMTAHVVYPRLDSSGDPATLSHTILTDLLRRQLGFDGVVVTDALNMQGVRNKYPDDRVPVLALKAGADVLLMPPDLGVAYNAVIAAVRSGELTEARIDASVRRILKLKAKRGIVASPYVSEDSAVRDVGSAANLAVAQQVADHTVTAVRNADGVLPWSPAGRKAFVVGFDNVANKPIATLVSSLTALGATATGLATGIRPSDEQIAAAVSRAEQSELVVVLTNRAWEQVLNDPDKRQALLVRSLQATGKPVVVAAVRDPYDLAAFPSAPTYLATYSAAQPSMTALARVLTGGIRPQGKLPVPITALDDPATVLYPRGFGLTW